MQLLTSTFTPTLLPSNPRVISSPTHPFSLALALSPSLSLFTYASSPSLWNTIVILSLSVFFPSSFVFHSLFPFIFSSLSFFPPRSLSSSQLPSSPYLPLALFFSPHLRYKLWNRLWFDKLSIDVESVPAAIQTGTHVPGVSRQLHPSDFLGLDLQRVTADDAFPTFEPVALTRCGTITRLCSPGNFWSCISFV